MQTVHQPTLAESLSGIWSALHPGVELTISEDEVHYLRTMALGSDDDIVSQLLLRKLQIARIVAASAVDEHIVVMNSFVEYSIDDGPKRLCQLVHPSALAPTYGLSVATLEGAGLIGMRSGQTILWPNLLGSLRDLRVLKVERAPRRARLETQI
jgi:regulator of nucleoside diphosphate kinase